MKRILALLAASLLFIAPAAAQRHGEAAVLKIWDNRTAPHSNGIASPEREPEPDRIENVSAAELYVFPADSVRDRGLAVVICPGGGYQWLSPREAQPVARAFAAAGWAAAVVYYTVREKPGQPPLGTLPVRQLGEALQTMQQRFPALLALVCGFSAGGHKD